MDEEFVDGNGRKYRDLSGWERITADKKNNRKIKGRIYELSEEEVKSHSLIGTASGQNFDHCVWLALRHEERFVDRVWGYRIEKSGDPEIKISVSFYERE